MYLGIEVVFIAPSSPWMNGSIENFNNWFGAKFWDKKTFTNPEIYVPDHCILLVSTTISVLGRKKIKN
ncbi:MAG TPA: hypothetical protein C5S37_08995 [Methanophagales archaeon]|nr:hypothetical protein [Methanophagales archaeon]HJH26889.1 hypothetical protein [Methanophagales archaeon]